MWLEVSAINTQYPMDCVWIFFCFTLLDEDEDEVYCGMIGLCKTRLNLDYH